MNYELLKKINDYTYDNFISIKNNIKNQDKNINNTFRITAEGLLKAINDKYKYVKEGNGFYNRAINNDDFLYLLHNDYKCDTKIMACLTTIQESGNKTTHNDLKVFDIKDVKEKYTRLIYFAQKILKKDYKTDLEMTNDKINIEFEILISENKNNTVLQTKFDKVTFINEITKYDDILKNNNGNSLTELDFCTDENINIFKKIADIIICSIIETNPKYDNIEDLKIGAYSYLYDAYYKIDNILLYDDIDDKMSSLKDVVYSLKRYLNNKYNIDRFNWLLSSTQQEEMNTDYREIAKVIEKLTYESEVINQVDDVVYYIDKQIGFYVDNTIYYELEIRNAIDYGTKNNKKIVYSKTKIRSDYAIRLSLASQNITFLGQQIEVYVITSSAIAIRPCEIKNMICLIIGKKVEIPRSKFYTTLMNYLEINECNLLDVVTSSNKLFNEFINKFDGKITSKESILFVEAINKTRSMILNEEEGSNVLRYILGTLNNVVIKKQTSQNYCVENTWINKRSLQFDRKPYSFSLIGHNPKYDDIARCIPNKLYLNDLVARKMKEYKVENQTVFVPIDALHIDNVDNYINIYNSNIYSSKDKIYKLFNKYVYIEDDLYKLYSIIKYVQKYTNCNNNESYSQKLKSKLEHLEIDSEEKKNILKKAFTKSKMLLLYGEAGSGKTELLCNYFTKIFDTKNILFVANTHAALNNMRKRVKERLGNTEEYEFVTVRKLCYVLRDHYLKYSVIIIDECKTISNKDILQIFDRIDFDYCVLSGDIAQIDAIDLGNWFEVCQKYANNSAYELKNNYRTVDNNLKQIWDKVRNQDSSVYDDLEKNKILENINSSIFEQNDKDEIILCLNYGGRYGINSINSYFQNKDDKKELKTLTFNLEKYKEGDPIVFNNDATEIYEGIIYNNLKGEIITINEDEEYMYFDLKIDNYIEKNDKLKSNMRYITSNKKENWSIINLRIKKYHDNTDDNADYQYAIPFDIAYARSIHKSQGLEYNSVKIIITPESEEKIDNSIFYTAITRSKKVLKIYTISKEQFKELGLLNKKTIVEDAEIIKQILDKNI